MDRWRSGLPYFLLVFLPYLMLLIYTVYSYPNLPNRLPQGLPKLVIWAPIVISAILPLTYGVLIFGFGKYLKKTLSLVLGLFMAGALLGLTFVIHLICSS